jgi:hypothetical protein
MHVYCELYCVGRTLLGWAGSCWALGAGLRFALEIVEVGLFEKSFLVLACRSPTVPFAGRGTVKPVQSGEVHYL